MGVNGVLLVKCSNTYTSDKSRQIVAIKGLDPFDFVVVFLRNASSYSVEFGIIRKSY